MSDKKVCSSKVELMTSFFKFKSCLHKNPGLPLFNGCVTLATITACNQHHTNVQQGQQSCKSCFEFWLMPYIMYLPRALQCVLAIKWLQLECFKWFFLQLIRRLLLYTGNILGMNMPAIAFVHLICCRSCSFKHVRHITLQITIDWLCVDTSYCCGHWWSATNSVCLYRCCLDK